MVTMTKREQYRLGFSSEILHVGIVLHDAKFHNYMKKGREEFCHRNIWVKTLCLP